MKKAKLALVVIMALALGLIGTAWAQTPPLPPEADAEPLEPGVYEALVEVLGIDSKSLKTLDSTYLITEETEIFSSDGKPISWSQAPTPRKAVLHLKLTDQEGEVLLLKVFFQEDTPE